MSNCIPRQCKPFGIVIAHDEKNHAFLAAIAKAVRHAVPD